MEDVIKTLDTVVSDIDATKELVNGIISYKRAKAIRTAIVGAVNATAEELATKASQIYPDIEVSVQAFRTKAAKLEKDGILQSKSVVNDKGDGFVKRYTAVEQ